MGASNAIQVALNIVDALMASSALFVNFCVVNIM
jgi:hypothetical protein